jgi:lipoate-protein ligase A
LPEVDGPVCGREGFELAETLIYQSYSGDPQFNLAVEELLLETVSKNQFILYLWQNRDSVVIGRHQNPWRECFCNPLKQDGVFLARRISGGGAIFHDLGSINFTFLMRRDHYDWAQQTGVILTAMRNLGIPAELNARNNLTLHGREFSGSGFCFRNDCSLHHGAILVASDLNKSFRYLRISEERIRSKGSDPVRQQVVNLIEHIPSLTTEQVMEALCQSYAEVYGGDPRQVMSTVTLERESVGRLYRKYASWDWRYGEIRQLDLELSHRFEWGRIEIGLVVKNGLIHDAKVYSDVRDAEFIDALSLTLIGKELNPKALAQAVLELDTVPENRFMSEALAAWLIRRPEAVSIG